MQFQQEAKEVPSVRNEVECTGRKRTSDAQYNPATQRRKMTVNLDLRYRRKAEGKIKTKQQRKREEMIQRAVWSYVREYEVHCLN